MFQEEYFSPHTKFGCYAWGCKYNAKALYLRYCPGQLYAMKFLWYWWAGPSRTLIKPQPADPLTYEVPPWIDWVAYVDVLGRPAAKRRLITVINWDTPQSCHCTFILIISSHHFRVQPLPFAFSTIDAMRRSSGHSRNFSILSRPP